MSAPLRLFALSASEQLGQEVARALGQRLAEHEERDFEDGEHKLRPLESVRDADVYVIQSLYGDVEQSVNEKLVRLLFFLGALRDAGAWRVTALMPYLCYSRKERQTKPRDPVSTRYMAALLEAMRIDCVVTLDVHSIVAYQNAFRCRTEHLEARKIFAEEVREHLGDGDIVVASPDIGGIKRAHAFQELLCKQLDRNVGAAFMDKKRSAGQVSGEMVLVGPVKGATVLLFDDQIVSGTTVARAARACYDQGAREVLALATHGVFTSAANERLGEAQLARILITNTARPFRITQPSLMQNLSIVDISPLLAEAIKRLHAGGSLVELRAT